MEKPDIHCFIFKEADVCTQVCLASNLMLFPARLTKAEAWAGFRNFLWSKVLLVDYNKNCKKWGLDDRFDRNKALTSKSFELITCLVYKQDPDVLPMAPSGIHSV